MVVKHVVTIGYQSVNRKTGQLTQSIKTKTSYFDSRENCEKFVMHWDTGLRIILWYSIGSFEHDLFHHLNELMDK